MNETIELRHSPYMNKWLIIGEAANQFTVETTACTTKTRNLVPTEELEQFSFEPTVVFEIN